MNFFKLSSAQKMLLFSEINNPHNDSFYLKFRKDYEKEDFSLLKGYAFHTSVKSSQDMHYFKNN